MYMHKYIHNYTTTHVNADVHVLYLCLSIVRYVGTGIYTYVHYMLFHALLWNMASYFMSDVPVFSRAEGELRIQHMSEMTSHIPQQSME